MLSPRGYTIVDGTTFVGLYAADGTTNVVDSSEEEGFVGLYHPSGAYWVTFTDDIDHDCLASNGSLNVYAEPNEE